MMDAVIRELAKKHVIGQKIKEIEFRGTVAQVTLENDVVLYCKMDVQIGVDLSSEPDRTEIFEANTKDIPDFCEHTWLDVTGMKDAHRWEWCSKCGKERHSEL